MSDQDDGAPDGGLPDVGDDESMLPAVGLPALAGRIEGVHGSVSTLGMRLDALVSSTNSYRSTLTDRLGEYSDLVSRLSRAQAAELEEYRRANERNLAELRKSLQASEQVLGRVGARVDELIGDLEDGDDTERRLLAEVRSILDSQENLSQFLTESLDQFAERVLERVTASQRELADSLDAVRTAMVTNQEATNDIAERVSAPQLRQSVDELRADVQGLRRAVLEWPDLVHVREQVDQLRTEVASLAETAGRGDQVEAVAARISALGDLPAALDEQARRIDGLTGAAGSSTESLRGLSEQLSTGLLALQSELATLQENGTVAVERLDAVAHADQIDALVARLGSFDPSAAVTDAIGAVDQRLGDLAEVLTVDDLRASLRELDGLVRAVHERDVAAEVGAVFADAVARVEAIDPAAALAGGFDATRESVQAVETKLTELGEELRSTGDTVAQTWGELAGLRTELSSATGSADERLRPLQSALESVDGRIGEIAERLAAVGASVTDDSRLGPISTGVEAARDRIAELSERVAAVDVAVAELASSEQIAAQRATEELGDRLDELARRLSAVDAAVEAVATRDDLLSHRAAFDEALLDVASGEVVAGLWDELHAMRGTVDRLADRAGIDAVGSEVAGLRSLLTSLVGSPDADAPPPPPPVESFDEGDEIGGEADPSWADADVPPPPPPPPVPGLRLATEAGLVDLRAELADLRVALAAPAEPDGDVVELTAEVRGLADEVRALLEQAEVADGGEEDDLRDALAEGIVVEPSEALTAAVDDLRDQIASLASGVDAVRSADVAGGLDELRTTVQDLLDRIDLGDEASPALTDEAPEQLGGAAEVDADLADAELTDRASDADADADADAELPPPPIGPVPELGDQLTALRDELVVELDAIREAIGTRPAAEGATEAPGLEAQLADLRDDLVDLAQALTALREEGVPIEEVEDQPAPAALDQASIETLVTEIRQAGAVSDQVLDALRQELSALRRRLAVKADGEVLTPEQVEALAARLAEAVGDGAPAAPGEGADAAADTAVESRLDDIQDQLADLGDALGAIAARTPSEGDEPAGSPTLPLDKLDEMHRELTAIRRRVAVRGTDEVLTAEQLDELAETIVARLGQGGTLTPEQLDQIGDAIAARFEIA